MRILLFSWRDMKHPQAGGSELYFHELTKRWAAKGNKITWICGGWKGCKKKESYDGMNFIRVGAGKSSVYILAPLAYFKLREKPDVIIDLENGIPFFTPLFSTRRKILHIHHVHKDVWFQGDIGKLTAIAGYLLETKLMPLVYRKNKVITISDSSSDEIVSEKFTKQKPAIVNPGIEFYKTKKFAKSKKPSLLFLNRIKKYKGIDTFLAAVKYLKQKGITNFDVWVAGSGEYLDNAKEYAKKMNLSNVQFLGRVSEEKKSELMQKAWAFMNPSFKEGWGIVNIEANYFGTPVIGSNVGGIKDSVVNGKTGLLFEYGDAKDMGDKILSIITDSSLRKKMELESVKWAKNFDWDSKADKYLKILQSI